MNHFIVSLGHIYPGHQGEWICYAPSNSRGPGRKPILLEATHPQDVHKVLPSHTPIHHSASMAYMISMDPSSPLYDQDAALFWPRRPAEVSPVANGTLGIKTLEALYNVPKPAVWFGIEVEFIGAVAIPITFLSDRVAYFAHQVAQIKHQAEEAFEKAIHQ